MCNRNNIQIAERLQTIAMQTEEDPAFYQWLRQVGCNLTHPAAITGTKYLHRMYCKGFKPEIVAELLNGRWN